MKTEVVECNGNYSDGYFALEIDISIPNLKLHPVLRFNTFQYEQIQEVVGGHKEMQKFFQEIANKINK